MENKLLNELFHERIEYAEAQFKKSQEYQYLINEWESFISKLDCLLIENNLKRESFQLNELPLAMFLGAAKYGYQVGYLDSLQQKLQEEYNDFIYKRLRENIFD